MGQAVSTCFRKYADFSGRASRSEFWFFYLFLVIVSVVLQVIENLIGISANIPGDETGAYPVGVGILSALWFLATLIPLLAVGVRRLHDTGRAGWWWFMWLLCCIGPIVLIVFWASPTTPADNQYGPPAS